MLTAMRDPSICVLCYTYNHVSYIERCLVGILEQAGDYRIKVIVRDDCSSDGTQDVVRDFANRYPKTVVPILESTNQWPSRKPLLAVMPHIDGDYLAFCEGDDFWNDPGKLQAQITASSATKGRVHPSIKLLSLTIGLVARGQPGSWDLVPRWIVRVSCTRVRLSRPVHLSCGTTRTCPSNMRIWPPTSMAS